MEHDENLLRERYKIIEKLGEGGMGEVYLAEDILLKRKVALKKAFESDDDEVLKAAEKEAQTLANLKHANLPTVHDYFVEDKSQYIVMEYVAGNDMGKELAENPAYFTIENVLDWQKSLFEVLDFLHNLNPPIIHRDIKPQNIKISDKGVLCLLDFGLVKNSAVKTESGTILTLSSRAIGYSKFYSPLEQIKGETTSFEADIYSLCATLYHFFTKTKPLDALDRVDILSKGQPDPLRNIKELNSNVPVRTAIMIMEGLQLHRERRPQNLDALKHILEGGETEPINEPEVQNPSASRIHVNLKEEEKPKVSEVPKKPEPEQRNFYDEYRPPQKKSRLIYAIPVVLLLLGLLGFYLYENSFYSQNKAIIERLEKAAIDDFGAIETEWDNYQNATKQSSYFKWGLNEVKDSIQKKVDAYANDQIEKYRTSGGRVGKSDDWKKPQQLLERILATDPNNKGIQAKIAYLKGQQDFASAFAKGADRNKLLDSARKYYQDAINLNSKFGDPYFMIAQTYIYRKGRDYSKALENIDLATQNGFPFDTRTKAVKADCLQASADETAKKENDKLKKITVTEEAELHQFMADAEESLKKVRDKYISAKNLYEEVANFGDAPQKLKNINLRLEKLDQGIDAIDKLHLLIDVISNSQNQSE